MKRLKRFSDNPQPDPGAGRGYYVISGNWSFVYKVYISLLCQVAYEKGKELTNHQMDYLRDASYHLRMCTNVDFVDHYKLNFLNIEKTVRPFLSNRYYKNDPQNLAFYTSKVLANILPVRYLVTRGFFPHSRSYFGNYKKYGEFIDRVYKIHKVTAIDLPQRRYIGVGYRDKGHRRNIAIDGSPGWIDLYSSFHHKLPRHERFYDTDFLQVCYEVEEDTKIEEMPYADFLDMLELEEENALSEC